MGNAAPLPILQINYLESIGSRMGMPLVKTLWKDFRVIFLVVSWGRYEKWPGYPGLPSISYF